MPSKVLDANEVPPRVRAGQVLIVDGRQATADQLVQELNALQAQLAGAGLRPAPLAELR